MTRSPEAIERNRARARERRRALRAVGMCVDCGRKTKTLTRCAKCNRSHKAYMRCIRSAVASAENSR